MKNIIRVSMLKDYIKDNHLSQKEFSVCCGIGVSTLQKILHGKTNYRATAQVKIARFMQIELCELFCG